MGFRKTLENTKGTNTTGQLATLGTRHRDSGNIGHKTHDEDKKKSKQRHNTEN
jgi:hypothetical protein